jgi:hypothetical protein
VALSRPLRLVTWNVAGRVTRQPEQAAAIAAVAADVVALQEVTARTLPLWRDALAQAGFVASETALEGAPAVTGRRLLGALTAAREPLTRLALPADVPWPERVLCCAVGDVEVVNVHSPISPSPDLAKVRTHEALFAYLVAADPLRRSQHAAPRAVRRRGPDLRPRQLRSAAPGARRALAPRRARARPGPARPRLDRRLPLAARLRRARSELDLRPRPRWLAPGPRPRARPRARRERLRPRLAPRGPERPLGADRRPGVIATSASQPGFGAGRLPRARSRPVSGRARRSPTHGCACLPSSRRGRRPSPGG